jgi:hypothetical protein
MIKDIAEWLEDQLITSAGGVLLEVGVNLFSGHLPSHRTDNTDIPDEAIVLFTIS